MADIDIKIKNTVPGFNTIKTMEKRKRYILSKLQEKIDDSSYYGYLIEELQVLEKVMNFIKWIQNNKSNDMVKEIIEQYKKENIEETAEETADDEMVDEEGAEVIGIFHEKFNKNYKLEIVLSIDNGIKFVTMREIRQKKDKIVQEETDKYRITLHKLERVLRRANEIENAPDTKEENPPDEDASNLPFANSRRKKRKVVVRTRSMV